MSEKPTELLAIELIQSHISKLATLEANEAYRKEEIEKLKREIERLKAEVAKKMNKPPSIGDSFFKAVITAFGIGFAGWLFGAWEKIKGLLH